MGLVIKSERMTRSTAEGDGAADVGTGKAVRMTNHTSEWNESERMLDVAGCSDKVPLQHLIKSSRMPRAAFCSLHGTARSIC